VKKRNMVAHKRPSATRDASLSSKRLSKEQLKLVAGGDPHVGGINVGDGLLASPNEPPGLG